MKKFFLISLLSFLIPFSAFASTTKVLVVAGGGGAGSNASSQTISNAPGGGGAGGVQYNGSYTVTAGDYGITVGAGGVSITPGGSGVNGYKGNDSVFDSANRTSILTATGGGGSGFSGGAGSNGGSGGGACDGASATNADGTNIFGNNGGGNIDGRGGWAGGGGGAGAPGGVETSGNAGAGGDGIDDSSVGNLLSLTTSGVDVSGTRYIAGGGGGGAEQNGNAGGAGGKGGGGAGKGSGSGASGDNGTPYTGGGGGAGSTIAGVSVGGAGGGGSGIVIIEFTTGDFNFTYSGTHSTGTSGALTWVKMLSSGTLTLSTVIPAAPTNLQVDSLTNPSNVATSSPYFSAIHANASTTALATNYEIQISTTISSWSSLYWDSGKLALSSSTPSGMRTPNTFSTTTFLFDGTTYYWRTRLWDQSGNLGDWSTTTDSFTMTMPTFDAAGHGSGTTGNLDVAVNTSSGNNRLLVCGLYVESTTKAITGVTATWASTTPMTQLSMLSPGWSTTTASANMYYFSLLGATSGNHNVEFAVSTQGQGGTVSKYATCASYSGVAQTAQPSTSAMHTETSVQSLSTSNKTTYHGSLLVGFTFFNEGNATDPTPGSGTTLRDFTDPTSRFGVLADNGTTTLSVGNPSLSVNRSASGNMATLQASWAPVHN